MKNSENFSNVHVFPLFPNAPGQIGRSNHLVDGRTPYYMQIQTFDFFVDVVSAGQEFIEEMHSICFKR